MPFASKSWRTELATLFELLKRVLSAWNADNAARWSASVAFYTLLSLAPLLILMVAIAGFVYGQETARGELTFGIRNLIGPNIAISLEILLSHPRKPLTGLFAIAFAGITLFFGASSVLTELHGALNAIWNVGTDQHATQFAKMFRLVKDRLYSFLVILGCGILLIASLAITSGLGVLGRMLGWKISNASQGFHLFVYAISFLAIAFVFAAIYKVIPDVDLNWGEVTVGGLVTAVLFAAGKQMISIYINRASLGSAYGAAGSLIVVLVWVYYSAQVFFLGAEFTKAYAETFGSRRTHSARGEINPNEPFPRSDC